MHQLKSRFLGIAALLFITSCSITVNNRTDDSFNGDFFNDDYSNNETDGSWVSSWGSSPFAFFSFDGSSPAPLNNQTLRQVVRLSSGGDQIRIRFSNEIGTTPLHIGSATVAISAGESDIKTNTLRTVTFGGKESIVIPAGAPALSDVVDLKVSDLEELSISLYFPEETITSTTHGGRIAYISSEGNFVNASKINNAEPSATQFFLSGVYVNTTEDTTVIAALGDSITDGTASTPFSFNSWPDHFSERVSKLDENIAIINHGISGNRVLSDGAGISALSRFDRDVLSIPGLTHIVFMQGINDIGMSGGLNLFGGGAAASNEVIPASDIIAGYQQLIARAHAMSPPIKIIGATLTPFEGVSSAYYSAEKDIVRKEVNNWIRTSGAFDGVIDFDMALRDPANPNIMRAEYNSGDNLHPGDIGYKRMAESIDLSLFE